MHFKTVIIATIAVGAIASPLAADSSNIKPESAAVYADEATLNNAVIEPATESTNLAKRQAPTPAMAILTGVAISGISTITEKALNAAIDAISALTSWDSAREGFTKKTVGEMWANNPDYNKFPAVACYNKGYRLKNGNGIDGRLSAKLSLGPLNTDYDCMYMTGNNAFYTDGDGGYVNLAYQYSTQRCSFDGNTGDLTCN